MKIYKTKSYYVSTGDFNITLSGRRLLDNAYGLLDTINNNEVRKLTQNGIVLIDREDN